MNTSDATAREQLDVCRRFQAEHVTAPNNHKVGIAVHTLNLRPINGLRHPVADDTTGWYIWGGNELSDNPDFFSPTHVLHLQDKCPEIIKYLGLPPGYRFIIDDDYEDVWYDGDLLSV